MVKEHSSLCNKFLVIKKDNESDVILHYNNFILKCKFYLDSQEIYNRKDFTSKLQEIYNENRYNFNLKENTIKNIISRWKTNSLRFTKYNALYNKFNKQKKLILWAHEETVIFSSNKKNLNLVNTSFGVVMK